MIPPALHGRLTRRSFGLGVGSAVASAAIWPRTALSAEPAARLDRFPVVLHDRLMPTVHRFTQTEPFPVNAFIIEGAAKSVVVDATLTNAASRALRHRVDEIGKPLAAVLLTHPHPDHYAGIGNLVAGLDVPIFAVAGVDEIVRRDDELKHEVVGAMFGDAWPTNRVFPTDTVADGVVLRFDDIELEARDIGPAESFHDSMFVLRGAAPRAFIGDLAYGLMHPYMADNQNRAWMLALARLQSEVDENTLLHVGHGATLTPGFLAWQAAYLERFEQAILHADWREPANAEATVIAAMKDYLPSESLLFFLQLSIAPNAERLGLL
jgi:glyoxylase-like metal-dependent hydrolase (beta-lactamase superfamily II)